MKKRVILAITALVITVALSSCTLLTYNVFKPLDKPSNLSSAAESALNAAKNGDTQSAVDLSTQVITTVASSSTKAPELYKALTTSATSPQSQKVIDKVASTVRKVKDDILNGKISKSSTEGAAIKDAAVAMVRSIAKVKKIELSDVISNVLNVLSSTSQSSTFQEKSGVLFTTTPSSTQLSQTVLMLLSITKDMPTMNLMSELTSLVAVYGGNDAFNWDVATILYDALYSSTALFDSNGDGVLTKQDEIFKYVWDQNKNEFKNPNDVDWGGVLKLQLSTYENQALCEKVMEKFSQAVLSFEDSLNHLPQNLINGKEEGENFLNYLEKIQSELNAQKLSSFKTVSDLLNFLNALFAGSGKNE